MTRTIGALVAALVLWAMPVYAFTDWDEGFEYTSNITMQVPNGPWISQCDPTNVGTSDPVTTNPHSGSRALRLTYPPPTSKGGCKKERSFLATTILYQRWWMYVSPGWLGIPDIGTKIIAVSSTASYPSVWWSFGTYNSATNPLVFGAALQGISTVSGTVQEFLGVNGGTIPRGAYTCVETEQRYNTPGMPNGVVRAWINGSQVLSRTDIVWRGTVETPICPGCGTNSPTAQMSSMQFYRQEGNGFIDYDDYAISRNERIGCGSSPPPPPDTTPPNAPTNLVAQ